MSLPNLDMDALRTLVAILQLGSLGRAAEKIGRSQSAASQQIRKLETQVGQPLFRKQGRAMVLTETGELVHSYARRILELNDEAVRSATGSSVQGMVRFGLPGDFAETWLPAALGQFKRAHPAVRVDVEVERNGLLLERLDRGEFDLVLAMGYGSRPDARRLATLPMTWIGPAGTEAVLKPDAPLDLALYNSPCFFRRAGLEALDKVSLSWRLAYATGSLQSLWAGVAAGLGITLRTTAGIPPYLMRLDERHGLPPLPVVELCLHAGKNAPTPALSELERVVRENAVGHLGV
ncbi:DNA-binding transcriptional regulator, LysR family [Dyella jiangningensis]|uniref:LysR substrate-binding domain-containing protein n=1 Tax=Dyella sp. AtDHG13 TaxID=1938897 RepID=UPI0008913C3B|nr:LysR substrate-binding domain-containing protein [Dyella sp. AtDHG13]PXV54082.1 DNA-binding transcriptional LysR family regulator [Dyella sp. AtDHG13]SDL08718.1 DNA-binding transcriptional regulator, LysR family [Dyella jiangningensis]